MGMTMCDTRCRIAIPINRISIYAAKRAEGDVITGNKRTQKGVV